jgi:hypothetical protein
MTGNEIRGLAEFISLPVEEERIPQILENLDRIAQVAAVVNAVALGPEDEIGPEWRP